MEALRTQMPADIERDDQLLGPLSPRQVLLCVICACIDYLLMRTVVSLSNATVGLIATLPLAIVCAAVIFSSRDGLSGDQYVRAAAKHFVRPKEWVYASEDLPSPPDFVDYKVATPYSGPATAFDDANLLLGNKGMSVAVEVSTVPFSLRSTEEQQALLSSYSRFLNSATAHLQIVVRTERASTTNSVEQLRSVAPSLPHSVLERSALAHADFLASLTTTTALFRRRVFVVINTSQGSAYGQGEIRRELSELDRFIRGVGGTISVLDQDQFTSLLDVRS